MFPSPKFQLHAVGVLVDKSENVTDWLAQIVVGVALKFATGAVPVAAL